ncbi:MAG: hypothetical protein ABWZ88_06260 [Variovorax sp.]
MHAKKTGPIHDPEPGVRCALAEPFCAAEARSASGRACEDTRFVI